VESQESSSQPFDSSNVLVTGGTGFTGKNLVGKLVGMGANVRVIARSGSSVDEEWASSVEWFRGNVYNPDVVRDAVEGVHYVFHVAACFRDAAAEEDEYGKVHVKSTQLLARAAVKQPSFRRFIHTSTIGVHGHVADPPASETAPYNPGDTYQDTKLEGELWIRDFAEREGLPLVVIRPAAIMGPSDRRLLKLFKFAKRGFFPLLDGHDTLYHLIHVEDLTDCMLLSAHHPDALGEVMICGNEEPMSVVEILSQIGDILGKKVRFIHLPSGPLFMVADAVEWISNQLGVEPILYRRRLAFFTKDRSFDTRKLRETLDFTYRYDNQSGIRDTAQGYMERGWL
jgi:nucleoside-diphosphate-sugar epimerase